MKRFLFLMLIIPRLVFAEDIYFKVIETTPAWEDIIFPRPSNISGEIQEGSIVKGKRFFDMILCIDGDYMDVYLDDMEHKLTTLALVDQVFLNELYTLVENNHADISKITSWPLRSGINMDSFLASITNRKAKQPDLVEHSAPIAPKEDNQPEPVIGFSVDIADTEVQQNEIAQDSAKKSTMPLWAWVVIIGLEVAVTGGVVLFIVKWRKRRFSA